jgi:hypothetical protein
MPKTLSCREAKERKAKERKGIHALARKTSVYHEGDSCASQKQIWSLPVVKKRNSE